MYNRSLEFVKNGQYGVIAFECTYAKKVPNLLVGMSVVSAPCFRNSASGREVFVWSVKCDLCMWDMKNIEVAILV